MHLTRNTLLTMALCLACGCANISTTRLPFIPSRGVEVERRNDQVQDPFPDADAGPYVGFRPREFNEQRSEIQRAKDRSYAGFLRRRSTTQLPPGQSAPAPVFANVTPEVQ